MKTSRRIRSQCFLPLLAGAMLLGAPARAQESESFPNAFRHELTRIQSIDSRQVEPVEPPVANTAAPPAEPVATPDAPTPEPGGAEHWSMDDQGLAEILPSGLARDVFEEVLRVNFFGTYLFYSKLDEQDQSLVYGAYTQSGTIESVREDVMSRSRLRHRIK